MAMYTATASYSFEEEPDTTATTSSAVPKAALGRTAPNAAVPKAALRRTTPAVDEGSAAGDAAAATRKTATGGPTTPAVSRSDAATPPRMSLAMLRRHDGTVGSMARYLSIKV